MKATFGFLSVMLILFASHLASAHAHPVLQWLKDHRVTLNEPIADNLLIDKLIDEPRDLEQTSVQTNTPEHLAEGDKSSETVILIHGFGGSRFTFKKLESQLKSQGYRTVNVGYPSLLKPIDSLAKPTIEKALNHYPNATKVHFVTHSMGAILLRYYLRDNTIDNIGRVVMQGPPNGGSEIVDKLKKVPGSGLIKKVSGMQLGTGALDIPKALGPTDQEVGIIAGNRSINPLLSALLPKPNDSRVTLPNTRLEGMTDYKVLPVSHVLMVRNQAVIDQTIHFLREGKFKH